VCVWLCSWHAHSKPLLSMFVFRGMSSLTFRGTFKTRLFIVWYFSDRASLIDSILITDLIHRLLFIHKILFSSTSFGPQVLIFRRIHLYICSIYYCHSVWEFLVACRYTAWVRTDRPTRSVTVQYAACIQLYTPEDEHLRLETCRGKIIFYQ